ncbi:hypothetical protein F511_03487 [Dorcoceras hygrometricum]|uniref:Uncharacterized protein n=1 Tax=Dorcoceras hygrometricum TaxID=472368 RepID=A0A2Z7DHT1_9LAMI|nr:hypothetical protein F511_03487 [Dorcoceras hygrometricum]
MLYVEARACGRKAKSNHIGLQSPVATEKVKRKKFGTVTTTAARPTNLENLSNMLNNNDAQKTRGTTAPIIIDVLDDSSA